MFEMNKPRYFVEIQGSEAFYFFQILSFKFEIYLNTKISVLNLENII